MEKRSLTNLLLGTALGFMAIGAAAGIALNYSSIASTVNGWMGDGEKVTFTQIVKAADIKQLSAKSIEWKNGTYYGSPSAADGTLTSIEKGAITVDAKNFVAGISETNAGGYSYDLGTNPFLHTGSFSLNYYSYEILSTKAVGSAICSVTNYDPPAEGGFETAPTDTLNVWKRVDRASVDSFLNYPTVYVAAKATDVVQAKNFMIVDIAGLGITDKTEANEVFKSLIKDDYFEGDKSFTKGEIKKAIADYEDAQKAIASSAASTSSAA